MQQILDRYSLRRQEVDANGNPVLDEKGKEVYAEMSLAEQRMAAEEFLAHLQETNGVATGEIYADHKAEIDEFAREHGMDAHDLSAENINRMVREWMAQTGFRPERPGWLKQLISRIRLWLNRHGFFVHHLSDDDILTILARSAKAEIARRRGKSAQGNGVRFALCEFEDHTRFVDVQADQSLFDGLSPAEAAALAKDIIKERFAGNVIGIDNKVFINVGGAKEYAYPSTFIKDEGVHQAKMQAAPELDNLVDAGKPLPDKPDGEDGHVHPNAVGGFSYLETIFKVGDEYYKGTVNIVNTRKGKLFKDVTKIENITEVITNSYGKNPKFGYLRDVSMPNINQSGEKSSGAAEDIRKTDVSKSDVSDRSDKSDNTRLSIDDGAGFVEPVPFTSSIDDSRGKNIVAMLRPIVGKVQSGFDKEVLARNLKERYGVDVSPVEALLWAREAARQNYVEEMRRQRKVRDQWLYENNLLWKQAVDYAGSENFKVRVSDRMNDRELSGTFWLKPGEKYIGTVIDLDALANEVARQQSRDALDVEQEFFDFFNGLDKPKLFHQYTEFRQQELAGDREAARRDKEEWMRQERYRIEDEVVRIIEAGQPVTEEWAKVPPPGGCRRRYAGPGAWCGRLCALRRGSAGRRRGRPG